MIRLVVSEPMGAVTTAKWVPLGRGSKAYVQSVGLNAEKKRSALSRRGALLSEGKRPSDGRPIIPAVANFDFRHKGVRALVKAFHRVKDQHPSAVLRLSGQMSAEVQNEVLGSVPESSRSTIEILGVGKPEDVPGLYREASVTVLPSLGEPSGRVLIESLTSGTPVVATNDGGLPEFVNSAVGMLFEAKADRYETMNVEGLAEAILEGLSLCQNDGIHECCRTHALQFSYEALGPCYEELYAGP